MTGSRTFADNSLITMGASVLQMAMGLCTSVLVARLLGPDGRGEYALALLFASMLVMFVDYGIGMASVFYLGQRKYRPDEILGANTLMAIAAAVVMVVVGLVVVLFFQNQFFPAIQGRHLLVALLMVPGQVYLNYMTMMLLGSQSVRGYNLIQILRGATFLAVLAVLMLALDLDVKGAIAAQALSLTATSVVLFYALRRTAGGLSLSFPADLVRDEVRYGLKTYAGTIGTFLHQRVDVLMLNWWTSASAVGLYSIAAKLAEETWLVSLSAGTVLFPRVSSAEGSAEIKDLTPRVCRSVLWVTAAMSLILAVPAHWVITTLFSEAFSAATDPFRILLIGTVSISGSRILQSDLAGRGRPELGTYITIAAGVVNIALNFALIPRFGIVGAAWTTASTYTLTLVLSLVAYGRISGNKMSRVVLIRRSDLSTMRQYIVSLALRIKGAQSHDTVSISDHR